MRFTPGAGTRAEARFAFANERWDSGEQRTAVLAASFDRSRAGVADHDEKFSGLDSATITAARSMGVTRVATRDEVLWPIIVTVPVQMIRNDRAIARPFARLPAEHGAAPVAGMLTGPDLLVQIQPRHGHMPTLASKRVSVPPNKTLVDNDCLPRADRAVGLVAREGAEASTGRFVFRHEGDAAAFAGARRSP